MTPFRSTPSIWIAFSNQQTSAALCQRISEFASAHEFSNVEHDASQFLEEITEHSSAWLLLDAASSANENLANLAKQAASQSEFFRCAIVGENNVEMWPDSTLYLDPNSLSTSIIDRLRNESHVLRIVNNRQRRLNRLKNR